MDAALRKRGLRLASNQVEFSLLRTMPLRVGLLDMLPRARRGAPGLLADRAGAPDRQVLGGQPAARAAARSRPTPWPEVDAVVAELRRIGEAHGGRTPSQVALAWLVAQGAVPIPGAKNRAQAEENAGALGWRMTDEELARLDAVALYGKRGISQRVWQHG